MGEQELHTLGGVIAAIVASGLIEVSPLKLNPWTGALSPLRKALVGNIIDKVDEIDKSMEELRSEFRDSEQQRQEDQATESRRRILMFNGDVLQNVSHTKEHYDQILEDIDVYEEYCSSHPSYPNTKCVMAIKNIKSHYQECLENNSFLPEAK